jgi:hypothetical protein
VIRELVNQISFLVSQGKKELQFIIIFALHNSPICSLHFFVHFIKIYSHRNEFSLESKVITIAQIPLINCRICLPSYFFSCLSLSNLSLSLKHPPFFVDTSPPSASSLPPKAFTQKERQSKLKSGIQV